MSMVYMIVSTLRVISYSCWMTIVHFVFGAYSNELICGYSNLPPKIRKQWPNRGAALMHAITMFSFAIYYWLFKNPDRIIQKEVGDYDGFCLDNMMGYIVYDTFHELATNREADVLGHHVMGYISHIMTRYYNSGPGAYFSMMVFLCEASTPYLHTSWLMHYLELAHTTFFKIIVGCLVTLFFVFRILLAPYMCYGMYTSLQLGLWEGYLGIFYPNFIIMVLFTLLNYFWFYKLLSVVMKVGTKDQKLE